MKWKKLRNLARATFMNPNFQSLCELGKPWRYSMRPTFKSSNLNLWMNWEKLCSNFSFSAENNLGNLRKVDHISNFFTNFKDLSKNCIKYMFTIGKNGFLNPLKILHILQKVRLRKDPGNTLTPLSRYVKNANINSNRKPHISTERVLQPKKVHS